MPDDPKVDPAAAVPGDQEPSKTEPAAADPKADDPKPAEPKPPWGSDDDFDPKRAWSLITDLRSDLDKIKTDRNEAQAKVKGFEDANKSESQRLEEAKSNFEGRATKAEQDSARLRVALRKGLTETQAKRLVGETEEDLDKDADELLADFKKDDDPKPGDDPKDPPPDPKRRPTERMRPGAVPEAEPDETDPRKLAEQVSSDW